MKKYLLVLCVQALTLPAFADLYLDCEIPAGSRLEQTTGLKEISISQEGKEKPQSNFPDASYMESAKEHGSLILHFSNECDNMYSVSIPFKAINEMRKNDSAVSLVNIEYYNAEMTEEETKEVGGLNIQIQCKLFNH